MKSIQATAFVTLLLGSMAASAGTPSISVNVSGEITPGVYGEVQIGNATPPQVVYAQPMIISKRSHDDDERPLYLYVPPGHEKHWSRHCREYNACNRPVYFVKQAENEHGRKDKKRREERSDEGNRDDQGDQARGRGHGNGHGRSEGRRD